MNLKSMNKYHVIFTILIVIAFLFASLGFSRGDVLAQGIEIGDSTATNVPTVVPTSEPTAVPTLEPTTAPTVKPTIAPTVVPTEEPTVAVTAIPGISIVPTATSPIGNISTPLPSFVWPGVSGASVYSFKVLSGSTTVYSKTVQATSCDSTNTCINKPTTQLNDGSYTWLVRAYVGNVWSDYSAALSFSVNTVPSLNSPIGKITGNRPTFTWTRIPNAMQYNYVVGSYYNKTVYTTSCGSSTANCSVTPANNIPDGSYSWKVRAYVNGIWRPYSTTQTFQVKTIPTLKAPSGAVNTKTPTFTWNGISGSTQYNLVVYKSSVSVYSKTITSTSCDSGTNICTSTPTNVLSPGSYTWKVRAYVGTEWKFYSSLMKFNVPGLNAFDSEFTSDATGWTKLQGNWSVSSGYYEATDAAGYLASSTHNTIYGTLTYEVRMKRSGDPNAAQGIYFGGTPTLLSNGTWQNGYLFVYANNGKYGIFEMKDGLLYTIQDWTDSSAVTTTFNVLKVTFNNTTGASHFFINGTEVLNCTLADFSSGQIGLTYADTSYSGDKLYVDYAKLSAIAPDSMVADLTTGATLSDSAKVITPSGFSTLFNSK